MITTLTLSLVWIVYSIIPQYLLLHYTWVGRGTTLRYACQIGFYISSLCAFCAIILLWLVYPKTVMPSSVCSPALPGVDHSSVSGFHMAIYIHSTSQGCVVPMQNQMLTALDSWIGMHSHYADLQ